MGSRSRCRFANELCSALQSTPNQNVLRDAVMQWGSESSSSVWPYCLKWRLQACVWEHGVRFLSAQELPGSSRANCWLPLRPSGSLRPCWPKPDMGFEEALGTWGGRTFLLEQAPAPAPAPAHPHFQCSGRLGEVTSQDHRRPVWDGVLWQQGLPLQHWHSVDEGSPWRTKGYPQKGQVGLAYSCLCFGDFFPPSMSL